MYKGTWRLRLFLALPLLFTIFFMLVPLVISHQYFSVGDKFRELLESARNDEQIMKLEHFRRGPFPASEHDNAFNYYEKAKTLLHSEPAMKLLKYYEKNSGLQLNAWDENERIDILNLVKNPEIIESIDEFRKGTSEKQAFVPQDLHFPADEKIRFSRDLRRCISIYIAALSISSREGQAWDLLLSALKVPAQFENDPSLLMQASLYGLITDTCSLIALMSGSSALDEKKAMELIKRLDSLKPRVAILYCLDFEMASISSAFASGINSEAFVSLWNGTCTDPKLSSLPVRLAYSVYYMTDAYAYLNYSLKLKNLLLKAYWESSSELSVLKKDITAESSFCLMSKVYLSAIISIQRRTAGLESEIEAAKLNLALNVYKKRNGSYPAKLSLLSPSILKEIPPDPLTGKPFMYSKTGDSYKLSCLWLEEKKKTASSAAPSASR